ncbi:hypothetical protein F0562_007450 [Nyssa sinensis]|uniref:Uncharacterized protein n=1 Tax=Nyssa sinensis TaxID=561372 RepID=A0A5J5A3E4_9ASTE|nr:hypothetical protein F0562_007450 [Nyssa sinensis]
MGSLRRGGKMGQQQRCSRNRERGRNRGEREPQNQRGGDRGGDGTEHGCFCRGCASNHGLSSFRYETACRVSYATEFVVDKQRWVWESSSYPLQVSSICCHRLEQGGDVGCSNGIFVSFKFNDGDDGWKFKDGHVMLTNGIDSRSCDVVVLENDGGFNGNSGDELDDDSER